MAIRRRTAAPPPKPLKSELALELQAAWDTPGMGNPRCLCVWVREHDKVNGSRLVAKPGTSKNPKVKRKKKR